MLVDAQKMDRFVARGAFYDIERARVIVRRARVLPAKEKLLLELALIQRLSHRQIAVALGRPVGSVSRQISRLVRRLSDPLIVALLDDACPIDPDVRWPAVHRLIGLSSPSAIAAEFQINPTALRRHVTYVRGWHSGLTTRPHAPPHWEKALATR